MVFQNETNPIYKLLSKENRNYDVLNELNALLSNQELVSSSLDGFLLHYLAETAQASEDISWRMVYALSNAGIDVNAQDSKGNTALHLAYMRGYSEVGFDFIEALLKCGTDLNLKNTSYKTPSHYMEKIEQLTIMYKQYYPGIWASVKELNIQNVQRLVRSFVKCNPKRNNVSLIDYASHMKGAGVANNSDKIISFLKLNQKQIEFVHFLYAIDTLRVEAILNEPERFDPNLADFSYSFSWYRPLYRNVPKTLLEIAFDTKRIDLIQTMLTTAKCSVNQLNSKTGDPFYFSAFEPEYFSIKSDLLRTSNLRFKNYFGQHVLFHIVKLYQIEPSDILIADFCFILKSSPFLLATRDQNQMTLIEWIILNEHFVKIEIFLKKISNLMIDLLADKCFRVFQDMIYHSYGIILLNTPIYVNESVSFQQTITFEQFVTENNANEMRIYLKKFYDISFFRLVDMFYKAIKSGDLHRVREFMAAEKSHFLVKIKDTFGRTSLHLAVLFGQKAIVKYFLQLEPNLVKCVDCLNRSPLHYAYALNDYKTIEMLNIYKIDKSLRDFKFLRADEYTFDEVRNDESFYVKSFRETQLCYPILSNITFLRCFIYRDVSESIRTHDIDRLKSILDTKLKLYKIQLKELPFRVPSAEEHIGDMKYIPPLELAIEKRNFLAFSFLLEELYSSIVSNNPTLMRTNERNFLEHDTRESGRVKDFNAYLSELREMAEDEEIYEIIDILDNFEEDKEIAAITDENPNSDFKQVYFESLSLGNIMDSLNKNQANLYESSTNNFLNVDKPKLKANSEENLLALHSTSNTQRIRHDSDHSKFNSKLCIIL